MRRLRVGIIGMGRIASGYDRPEGPVVRTHVKACLSDPRLELAYISDREPERARAVKEAWGLAAEIVDPQEFFGKSLDIVCISTPSETHTEMLMKAASAPPRLILCEKPLGGDLEAAAAAVARLEKAKTAIAVNMLRRWIPGMTKWMDWAHSGKFGKPIGVGAIYSGGFWNNGAHAIDLVSAFAGGSVTGVRRWGAQIADRSAQDPTVSLFANIGEAPFWMHGVDGRVQTAFRVEFLFERGRIRIEDEDGVRARLDLPAALDTEEHAPELRLAETFHDKPATLMARVWSNLADHLLTGEPIACRAADALAGHRMQHQLAASMEAIAP